MWFDKCVMYQIYPIGFCVAPKVNDGVVSHRLDAIAEIIPHLEGMGVNAVMLNPVVKSSTHGYDTVDFYNVDERLGTNDDLKRLVDSFHEHGIKVVYDAVFNHVGRAFPRFVDVKTNMENSAYKDWFYIDFSCDSAYHDGFSYADWEGCAELVKLRLDNPAVQEYIFDAVRHWISDFGIDGLRLDVARLLPGWFFEKLREVTSAIKPDFPLIGEVVRIHEHVQNVCPSRLDSVTNYECFSGMISSVNQPNFFEIAHSIERNFARGGLFYGKPLLNFVDNHDVVRAATAIRDERNLKVLYTLLFALPGVPCIYYGSEYKARGDNRFGDDALRPAMKDIDKSDRELVDVISALSKIRREYIGATDGEYKKLYLNNKVYAFSRGNVIYAFNVSDCEETVPVEGTAIDVPAHGATVVSDGKTLAYFG